MSDSPPLDSLGRRRSPASAPGYLAGRPPRSKGRRYPADPPRTEEIIAVMRCCGEGLHGARARGLIVVLWRAGLRIQEALDLTELDIDRRRGSVLVRRGKGGRRREVGVDDWGFEQLDPWLQARGRMPVGPLFCVINGRTCGRAWHASAARAALRRRAARAGVRRRFAPAPAASRARARTPARGRPAQRHPAPARTPQPRRDLDLSPRGLTWTRSSTPSTPAARR
jgi:integrase